MQNIHQKISSVLNVLQVVEGVVADPPPPPWHDVGARNALVTRGLIILLIACCVFYFVSYDVNEYWERLDWSVRNRQRC